MKITLQLTALFIFATATINLFATSPKLSPYTKKYLYEVQKNGLESGMLHKYVVKTIGNKKYISALIKINAHSDLSSFQSLGIKTGTRAGNILCVQIPLESMTDFIQLQGIEYIQIDEPSIPTLDSVRIKTRVDSVQAGIGLPMPYNGEGVVVGVVDAGFDFGSPAFFDTTGVNYRVKKAWLQKNNSGTPPTGYAYGTEIFDSTALWTVGHDNDGTHATHVSGICAGSGFGSPANGNKFRGIAYKSDVVCVGITPDKSEWVNTGVSDMIDGINYIYTYADSVSKPAVVNLSWGSPLGPHDGTGLFSQSLDALTGAGKIFVCSAGNNGDNLVHVQKTFTASDTIVQTFLEIADSPEGKKTWVDIWGDTAKTFCVQVSLYNNGQISSTGFVCLDDSMHNFSLLGSNNDTCFVSVTTSASEFNMRPRVFLDFDSHVTMDSVVISIKGAEGIVNFWNSFVSNTSGYYGQFLSYGYPWAVDGDIAMTISDIASSRSAITVGAYASKIRWTNISLQTYSYASYVSSNDLVPFSSHGPTSDGRVKPDITGPGLTVGSSLSSYDTSFTSSGSNYIFVINNYHNPVDNRDYPYGQLSGTSMSSPAVSGITALMLEVKNDLTPQDVKDIMTQTAIRDSLTGIIPPGGNVTWGNGKVNAYGAVQYVVQWVTGINTISAKTLECTLFPNPNNGIFTIDYNGNTSDDLKIEIFDTPGHCVYTESWKTNGAYDFRQLDVKDMAEGIYFTKVSSHKGYTVFKMMVGK
jgi:minor extracellular serine protease Vpr